MFGPVDVAGTQVTDQKLFSTENVERQKAVMVIVAMKEAPFLLAVDSVIGGIEIQDEFIGCGSRAVSYDEGKL